jgi:NAD(P)-dependent dehydrogenase (short-subunit alcohol dehydrogenase family)
MSADVLSAGNVAVITGAGSGIGAAIARAAAARGMRTVLADVAPDRIEALAAELRDDGATVACVPTDVSDAAQVDRLAAVAAESFGPVNLLVNNAGIETTGRIWEIDKKRWDATIAINVTGVYHGVRSFVPAMIAEGAPAHIVNLASVGSLMVGPFQAPYIASKHAVLALTECLFHEFQAEDIRIGVSAVLPGPVSTRIFADAVSADENGVGAQQRKQMQSLLDDAGISPQQAADVVLAAVEADRLWIHTHPDWSKGAIQQRCQVLLDGLPHH